MGLGTRAAQLTATATAPGSEAGPPDRHPDRLAAHCDSFYWDISSVITKTACLATFFVTESPRRLAAFAARRPEPKPLFTCRKWGYRMCACGHHYYSHGHVNGRDMVAPSSLNLNNISLSTQHIRGDSDRATPTTEIKVPTEQTKKRRRRFWFF